MKIVYCPVVEPKPDKYGRYPDNFGIFSNSELCYRPDSAKQSKLFDVKKEADWFIKEGKIECAKGLSKSWCEGWKIDSVYQVER